MFNRILNFFYNQFPAQADPKKEEPKKEEPKKEEPKKEEPTVLTLDELLFDPKIINEIESATKMPHDVAKIINQYNNSEEKELVIIDMRLLHIYSEGLDLDLTEKGRSSRFIIERNFKDRLQRDRGIEVLTASSPAEFKQVDDYAVAYKFTERMKFIAIVSPASESHKDVYIHAYRLPFSDYFVIPFQKICSRSIDRDRINHLEPATIVTVYSSLENAARTVAAHHRMAGAEAKEAGEKVGHKYDGDDKHSIAALSSLSLLSPSSSPESLDVSSRFSERDEKTKKEEMAFMDRVECESISKRLKTVLDMSEVLTFSASRNEIKLLNEFLGKGVTPSNLGELDLHMNKTKKVIAVTESVANVYETLCNLESNLEKMNEEKYKIALSNLESVLNKHDRALTLEGSKQTVFLLRKALNESGASLENRGNVALKVKHAAAAIAAEPAASFFEQLSNLHLNIHETVDVQHERKCKHDREMLEEARKDHLTDLNREGRKKFDL